MKSVLNVLTTNKTELKDMEAQTILKITKIMWEGEQGFQKGPTIILVGPAPNMKKERCMEQRSGHSVVEQVLPTMTWCNIDVITKYYYLIPKSNECSSLQYHCY